MKFTYLIIPLTLLVAVAVDAQNRVLELDGDGDYVELPSNVFNELDEATVEGWVKWARLGFYCQPFAFGSGDEWQAMVINNRGTTSALQFFIYIQMKLHLIRADNVLQLGQWCHIAAVSGRRGMKLYLNGVLVGEHKYTGSFSAVNNGELNAFGKSNWSQNDDFQGQLDEIRVWGVARTGEQIRAWMYRKLQGNEKGLVGLWNFDDGDARDGTANGYDGMLVVDAHCIEAELPAPNYVDHPAVLSGVITDEAGNALPGVDVRLEQDGKTIARTTTD